MTRSMVGDSFLPRRDMRAGVRPRAGEGGAQGGWGMKHRCRWGWRNALELMPGFGLIPHVDRAPGCSTLRHLRRTARGPGLRIVVLAIAGAMATSAWSQSPAPSAPSPVQFGGELRVRGESFANVMDLDNQGDDAYQFARMRYRLWADAKPREGLRIYLRLGNEYRWGQWVAASIRDPESRVSLDNGWAEIAWPAAAGLTWKLGRMDFAYGEGFLISEGTPVDGSSSGFFDGMRLQYRNGGGKVDLFSMKLVDRGFGTTAGDEDFHGLYFQRAAIEAYVLHRFKHQATIAQQGKPWQVPQPRQQTAAIGGRLSHLPETGWQGAIEGAGEFGTYQDQWGGISPARGGCDGTGCVRRVLSDHRRALGAYARGGFTGSGVARIGVELGTLHLSGDDPRTADYEGWDDFYGEWAKYSELLIYTMYDGTTRMTGGATGADDAGAWTNLQAAWIEGKVGPLPGLRVTVRGSWLRAAEPTGPGTGKTRGTLLAVRADCTGIPGVSLQALGEWFDPGDFYARGADSAWYARFQVVTGF